MSPLQLEQLNLNLLLVLDALLQTRSVTESAARLSVTPSAVSHNLRSLRALFEDPLFVRSRGGLTPTPRAEAMQGPLRLALRGMQDALHATPFAPETARKRFVLAIPDFLGHLVATRIYEEIAADWTGIDLDILPSARADNAWRLETGELTAAVGGVVPHTAGESRVVLYVEDLVLVMRPGHPLADQAIDAVTYGRHPQALVGLEDHYDPDDTLVDRALAEVGVRRRVAIRQRSFLGTLATVLATDLITTLPRTMAAWAVLHHDALVRPAPIGPITYAEELIWHSRFDHDASHGWIRDRILAAIRSERAELLAAAADRLPPSPLPPPG